MALVVEDGTIVANADSYVSLADANAYFAIDVIFDTTWGALTDADKEQYIKWATRILDQKTIWRGTKTDEDSALRWPRTGVYDRDGNAVDSDVMPVQLKHATFELIKFLVSGSDPTTGFGADYVKRLKADVIEIEYQEDVGQPTGVPPIINQILRGLGRYPMALGFGFARIVKV